MLPLDIKWLYFAKTHIKLYQSLSLTLMPGGTKRSHILKQTCSFQLQVCLSMCDIKGLIETPHVMLLID